jgi:hypothetical protein
MTDGEIMGAFGPFGSTALPVEQALRLVAEASVFWAAI